MFGLGLDVEQKQTLSVRQMQSLQILSYTNQELENFMTDEYLENPMLDNSVDKQDEMIKDLEQLYEKGTSYKDHYLQWEDEDSDRKSDLPAREPDEIYGYIMGQLHRKRCNRCRWLCLIRPSVRPTAGCSSFRRSSCPVLLRQIVCRTDDG